MIEDSTFRNSARIIRAAESMTLSDAFSMKQAAEQTLTSAQTRIAEAHAEARRKGEEEGLRSGREIALRSLSHVVATINARFASYENDLSQVAVIAVQRILGQIPDAELVNGAVRRALADLLDQTGIILLVAPEERARTEAALLQNSTAIPDGIREIRADASLAPGDMILETNHGRYNIGLQSQLQRLSDGLRPNGGP
jgi:flagellar biosynthesis/type III secretory pathway protein FliH